MRKRQTRKKRASIIKVFHPNDLNINKIKKIIE